MSEDRTSIGVVTHEGKKLSKERYLEILERAEMPIEAPRWSLAPEERRLPPEGLVLPAQPFLAGWMMVGVQPCRSHLERWGRLRHPGWMQRGTRHPPRDEQAWTD